MARRLPQLVLPLAALLLFAPRLLFAGPAGQPSPAGPACPTGLTSPTPALAPDVATPAVSATPTPAASASPKPKNSKPDDWTSARHIFEQLSPDQQKKFVENMGQWRTMSPEEQELLRDRELFRRAKIAEEIESAINRSSLNLDEDQRELYALRYTQERRKIEESLHKQMDQKRQSMVTDMLARLKREFAPTPAPSPAAKPAASATPAH